VVITCQFLDIIVAKLQYELQNYFFFLRFFGSLKQFEIAMY
jgi:hypothetical protein